MSEYQDNLEEYVKTNESKGGVSKPVSYPDMDGRSIGHGFHLNKEGAKERVEAKGYDWQELYDQKASMSAVHANELFQEDLETAQRQTKEAYSNFSDMNEEQQTALTDMMYNMNPKKLKGFKKMNTAIKEGRWDDAGYEMNFNSGSDEEGPTPTAYSVQTGKRSVRNRDKLSSGAVVEAPIEAPEPLLAPDALPPMGEFEPTEVLEPMAAAEHIEAQIPESVASEEAFYTAALSGDDDPVAQYTKVKSDIEQTGRSVESESTRARIAKELNFVKDEELFNTLYNSNMTHDQQAAVINDHLQSASEVTNVNMAEEAVIALGANNVPVNTKDRAVHETVMDGIDEVLDAQEDVVGEMDYLGQQMRDVEDMAGMASAIVNFLATAVPFNIGNSYRKIMNEVLPQSLLKTGRNMLFPGEALDSIKEHLNNLPPLEQQEFARNLVMAIDANSGFLGSNDFIKYMIGHEVFGDQLRPENIDNFDWDRTIENVSGLLDVVFAGQMVRGGARILKGISGSSQASRISAVTREDASKLLADGIITPEVAKALGVTSEEILTSTVLPKPIGFGKHTAYPSDVAERLKVIQKDIDRLEESTQFSTINLSRTEIDTAITDWKTTLAERDGGSVYSGMLEVGKDGEMLVAKGMYGASKTHGFSNGMDASRLAKEWFGDAPHVIMKRRGDKIVKAKSLSGKGEYFIQMETKRNFSSMDALLFGDDVHIGGAKAQYLGDSSARFSREISDAGLRAHDLGKAVVAQLTNFLKPFQSLRTGGKLKVIQAVQDGSKQSHVWTHDELLSFGFNNAEQIAYHSWRGANDALYMLNNARYRRQLINNDMKYLTNSSGGTKMLGRPVAKTYKPKTAYDPKTNSIVPLERADIDNLYASGGQIMELQKPKFMGDQGTEFMIYSKSAGSKMNDLPEAVLTYQQGYTTRYYKDMYFIDEVRMVSMNGAEALVKKSSAVHTAGSKSEALKLADEFNAGVGNGEAGLSYVARRGAEHTAEQRQNQLFRVEEARGRTFFSGRGEQLKAQEGLADIEDPIDSLLRGIETTARSVSHEPFVNSMKQRWMNTYGDLLKPTAGQKFPDQFSLVQGGLKDSARVAEARALHDYISLMAGVPDDIARKWKAAMMGMAEKLDGKGLTGLSKMVAKVGDKDPSVRLKGLTFNLFLGANPIRQVALQSQQFLFVAPLAPKYMLSKFLPHKLGIDIGMLAGMGSKAVIKGEANQTMMALGAKTAGMSMPEYKHLLETFKRSGLPYSIDSNVFARDSLKTMSHEVSLSASERAQKYITTIPHKAMKAAKMVGFDFGEYNNLASTFLVARSRYMSKTGKTWNSLSARDLDQIAADTRQLALSMTEAGSLGYQKGYFSLMTQFLSIQHKALAAALPKKFGGNQAFTGSEKFRIFGGQTLFYGAAGMGVSEAYKFARDKFGATPSPELDAAIQGGVADYVLLNTFGTDVKVSNSFAPAAGVHGTLKDIIKGALNTEIHWGEALFGASWKASSRVVKALTSVANTYARQDLSNPETTARAIHEGMKVFSGYNNWVKGKVAMNLGYHVSAGGDLIQEATFNEAIAKMGGYGSSGIEDYYDIKEAQPRGGQVFSGGTADEIRETAQTYYDHMNSWVIDNPYDPSTNLDGLYMKRLNAMIETENLMLSVLDPAEADAVMVAFRQISNQAMTVGTDVLFDRILNSALEGDYGVDTDSMLTTLKNSSMIKTPEQAKQVQDIYEYLTKE